MSEILTTLTELMDKELEDEGLTKEFISYVDLEPAGNYFPVMLHRPGEYNYWEEYHQTPEKAELLEDGRYMVWHSTWPGPLKGEIMSADTVKIYRARYLFYRDKATAPMYRRFFNPTPDETRSDLYRVQYNLQERRSKIRAERRDEWPKWRKFEQEWQAEIAMVRAGEKPPHRETPTGETVRGFVRWLIKSLDSIAETEKELVEVEERLEKVANSITEHRIKHPEIE